MSSIIHSLLSKSLLSIPWRRTFQIDFSKYFQTQFGNEREETSSFSPNMFFVGFWALATQSSTASTVK